MSALDRPKPRGFRRIERWGMSLIMGIIAFALEKIVMRSIRKSGREPATSNGGTKVTTKGGEVDVEEQ